MTVTVSHLKNVKTLNLSYAAGDFANASSWYSDALDSLISDVQKPVDSGHIWTGGGQPDASTVVEINRTALGIGELEMDAASKAMLALESALASAQGYLLSSLFEADQKNITVKDDGSASYDHVKTVCAGRAGCFPDGESVSRQNDAKRIEREVKGYLGFAAIADATCRGILDRVASHTPSWSSTADPSVLAYNQSLVNEVLKDHDMAVANQKFWDTAVPQPLAEQPSGWDKFWHGVGNFFSAVGDHIGDLTVEGLSMVGGAALMVLGAGTEVGGVALDLTGVGAVVGVPANVAGVVVIGTGATVTGLGAAGLTQTMNQVFSQAMNSGGSGTPSTSPQPPSGVATKPPVGDTKLGNIVDDLYKGTKGANPTGDGTTADAVRAERMTGSPTGGKWHFGKAGEYIYSLQKWLAEHPNASAADKAVANDEIANLQNALGPKDAW